jgi:hypothetical protein
VIRFTEKFVAASHAGRTLLRQPLRATAKHETGRETMRPVRPSWIIVPFLPHGGAGSSRRLAELSFLGRTAHLSPIQTPYRKFREDRANLNRRVAVFPLNALKSIDISRGSKNHFREAPSGLIPVVKPSDYLVNSQDKYYLPKVRCSRYLEF